MSKLYEAKNHILIRPDYGDPAPHRHMAAHIIVSLNGNICVEAEGTPFLCPGVVLPSGVLHKIDTRDNPVLVFLFDGTTAVAHQAKKIRTLSESDRDEIAKFYHRFETTSENFLFHGFVEKVLSVLDLPGSDCCVNDDRIKTAMGSIRFFMTEKTTCKDIAQTVHLSQSRFSHLFHQETGMTFAAYLIYQRIVYAYKQILSGKSITEAALEAGFSSSAHFSDVNHRIFGLSARTIAKNLSFRNMT